jgi:hypothetical protein
VTAGITAVALQEHRCGGVASPPLYDGRARRTGAANAGSAPKASAARRAASGADAVTGAVSIARSDPVADTFAAAAQAGQSRSSRSSRSQIRKRAAAHTPRKPARPAAVPRRSATYPSSGTFSAMRPVTAAVGTRAGSGAAFASPLVSTYATPFTSARRVMRWVYGVAPPCWIVTTSPTAYPSGPAGRVSTNAPRPISGSMDPPPITSVRPPARGASSWSAAVTMTARTATTRSASRARRVQRRAVIERPVARPAEPVME